MQCETYLSSPLASVSVPDRSHRFFGLNQLPAAFSSIYKVELLISLRFQPQNSPSKTFTLVFWLGKLQIGQFFRLPKSSVFIETAHGGKKDYPTPKSSNFLIITFSRTTFLYKITFQQNFSNFI